MKYLFFAMFVLGSVAHMISGSVYSAVMSGSWLVLAVILEQFDNHKKDKKKGN